MAKPVKGLGAYDSSAEADYTGMRETLRRRLADPSDGPLIRRDIEYEIDRQGGPEGLLIMDYPDKSLVVKTLGQAAKLRHEDPIDTAIHFQMNGFDRVGGIEFRAFAVSLLDLEEFMRKDYTGVCTDRTGASVDDRRAGAFIHPGTFGTAPRRIKTCVLLEKTGRRTEKVKADFVGFSIPDLFVVGYGLDFAERYRNLPFVAVLHPHLYE